MLLSMQWTFACRLSVFRRRRVQPFSRGEKPFGFHRAEVSQERPRCKALTSVLIKSRLIHRVTVYTDRCTGLQSLWQSILQSLQASVCSPAVTTIDAF